MDNFFNQQNVDSRGGCHKVNKWQKGYKKKDKHTKYILITYDIICMLRIGEKKINCETENRIERQKTRKIEIFMYQNLYR